MTDNFPPEFSALSDLAGEQPGPARELFYYCMALLMIESGKARLVETHPGETGQICTFETAAGEQFALARPAISEEAEAALVAWLRGVLEEEGKQT